MISVTLFVYNWRSLVLKLLFVVSIMYYKRGKRCKVSGCCNPSKKFCKPESSLKTNKPDAIFPRLWQDAYNTLRFVPYSIIIFFYDIYSHSVLGQPKRTTWDITTTLIIALLHAVRYSFQESSIALWRVFLKIPYFLSSTDRYYSASFFARKLNLPGILQDFDSHEDGLREINAHWLLPLERTENEDDNVILYLHGGGYCMKDWQAYFTISQSLSEYLNCSVFGKLFLIWNLS